MPKLLCENCGTSIDLTPVPSPYGFRVIADAAFDAIREKVRALASSSPTPAEIRTAVSIEVLGAKNPAIWHGYICPTCGEFYLFKAGGAAFPDAIWRLVKGEVSALVGQSTDATDLHGDSD
jgi:hypothetical protein